MRVAGWIRVVLSWYCYTWALDGLYKKGIAPIAISYRALNLENDITGGSQIEGFPI